MPVYGIAISGKQLAGKTTTKNRLREYFERSGYEVHDLSFAAPLKAAVEATLRAAGVDLAPDWKYEYRGCLTAAGTTLRNYDDAVWVNLGLAQVRAVLDKPGNAHVILCDDCRYVNEADALRAAGFFLVRLDIARETQDARGVVKETTHPSETELDAYPFDARISTDHASPAEVMSDVLAHFGSTPLGVIS